MAQDATSAVEDDVRVPIEAFLGPTKDISGVRDVLHVPDDVRDALRTVRSPKSPFSWAVVAFETQNTLSTIALGVGGIDDALRHFFEKDAVFCLISLSTKVDEHASTTKELYVSYVPATVPPMRKALLAVLQPQVRSLFSPFSGSIETSERAEITSKALEDLLAEATGAKRHELDHQTAAVKQQRQDAIHHASLHRITKTQAPSMHKDALRGDSAVALHPELADKIRQFRDGSEDGEWVLSGFAENEGTELVWIQSGTGGVDALMTAIDPARDQYALFRVIERRDAQTTNVRIGYVRFQSESTKPRRRGMLATLKGSLDRVFSHYHVQFSVSDKADLTHQIALERIADVSGSASHTQARSSTTPSAARASAEAGSMASKSPKSFSSPSPSAQSGVRKPVASSQVAGRREKPAGAANAQGATLEGLTVDGQEELMSALAAVHADAEPVTWVMAQFVKRDRICFVCSGTDADNAAAFSAALPEGEISFGLLRVRDVIDGISTVKFVFLLYQSDSVSPMKKAFASTSLGKIRRLFSPWHVEIFATDKDELLKQEIDKLVGSTSGSRSNVTEKDALYARR